MLIRKQNLILYTYMDNNHYRTVIKTTHGRLVYLELALSSGRYNITDYYYVDRINGGSYYAAPTKLVTLSFDYDDILQIVEAELDRKYYGVEVNDSLRKLSADEFIKSRLVSFRRKYNFLIIVGEGKSVNGIPEILKTRFKNRIHRSIYIELHYNNKNNKGVVWECYYYDRAYKVRSSVMPETLTSVFFEYSREAIISVINNELNADFTDIIFVTDGSIDINNSCPLCGSI